MKTYYVNIFENSKRSTVHESWDDALAEVLDDEEHYLTTLTSELGAEAFRFTDEQIYHRREEIKAERRHNDSLRRPS